MANESIEHPNMEGQGINHGEAAGQAMIPPSTDHRSSSGGYPSPSVLPIHHYAKTPSQNPSSRWRIGAHK
ncbi:hypothetical protein JCGZ_19336 [Jatropha curcas]|uniref:Uncharacterized protein n=1 Tax=Jatropha curcas TaxID=180498 RepID=A0A067K037_JATCU|nr:hypothetical protein JCGZ_19336 [Jatropha curcas]